MATLTFDQMFQNGNIVSPLVGGNNIFSLSNDKGTTVGGYVLVTHANVSYITHHS